MPSERQDAVPYVITAFVAFALFYYSYVYFYDFEKGFSAAPPLLKAVKDGAYLLAAIVLASLVPWMRTLPRPLPASLMFVPLAAVLVVVSVVHASHTALTVQIWENIKNIAIYIPLFIIPFYLSQRQRVDTCRWLFAILLFAGVTQSLFSIIFRATGGILWEDRFYAGLVGNPNSFALLLNLGSSIVLAYLPLLTGRQLIAAYSWIILAAFTILGTTSGSQSTIFAFLLINAAILYRSAWRRYLAAAGIVGVVVALNSYDLATTAHTMAGLGSTTMSDITSTTSRDGIQTQDVSLSVSNRVKDVTDTLALFSKGVDDILLGDFDTASYRPMDGQFFVFLFNGGLITLAAFAIPAAAVYLMTLGGVWRNPEPRSLALHLMITAFGVTFVASRVLMYFPFNFLFFIVSGLAVASYYAAGATHGHQSTSARETAPWTKASSSLARSARSS